MESIGKTRIRLQVKYEKSNGNYHRFSIKDVNRDLPAEKIKSSLGKLAIVDLFDQDGVGLFKKAVEAKFVETTESKSLITETMKIRFKKKVRRPKNN